MQSSVSTSVMAQKDETATLEKFDLLGLLLACSKNETGVKPPARSEPVA